jgi:5-methylcytosine-specific restriction endonuclease McrA
MPKSLFVLDGRDYFTKKNVQAVVRDTLKPHKNGQMFGSPILSDLFTRYHPYCQLHELRPLLFRKGPIVGPTWTDPDGLYMLLGQVWASLSWITCIDGTDWKKECQEFLRWRIASLMDKARKLECETCGSTDRLDVDHANPTFDLMFQQSQTPYPENMWQYYHVDRQKHFQLPDNHPMVSKFMKLHSTAVLVTLCSGCHHKVTAERRKVLKDEA